MSTPVRDEVVRGCVTWLGGLPDIADAVSAYQDGTPLLFQHKLWVAMEGTSTTAAVISRAGGWSGSNAHNTMRFPRLSLELYADPLRDAGKNLTDPGEVWSRIEAAFDAFDKRLHRPDPTSIMWGTLRTIGCERLTDPMVYEVPDGDGLLRSQTFYGVSVG